MAEGACASGDPHVRVVVGTETLSQGWRPRTKKFPGQIFAEVYLQTFDRSHTSMDALRTIANSVGGFPGMPRTDAEIIATVAHALIDEHAWLIELPRRGLKSRNISKTSPAAFAPINPKFGTKVDFAYIAKLEGDQWLRGYVPFKGKTGIVAGRSGMTIASGFDLGQWFPNELAALNLPTKLLEKITPFAAPNNFKGMDKRKLAAAVGKLAPVPELDQPQADQCDAAVFRKKLEKAMKSWDNDRSAGVPMYVNLPGGWQTVWLSRIYQGKAAAFGAVARAGRWKEAIAVLRADKQYASRTNQEADMLERELPPAVVAPGVPK